MMSKQVKFNRPITDFQYVLSFDLATHITGWSFMEIHDNVCSLISYGIIDSSKFDEENFFVDQLDSFEKVITKHVNWVHAIPANEKGCTPEMYITKERLPSQAGTFSTIATLQSLAQTHAIFDLAVERSGEYYYDKFGVHSVSVKSYFKSLNKDIEKPTKEDIRSEISVLCGTKDIIGLDTNITDSMAVSITLHNKKWNADIDEQIREIKRNIKKYKSDKKINELKDEIKYLEGMKL